MQNPNLDLQNWTWSSPWISSDLRSDNSFPYSPNANHCFFQELNKHFPARPLHLLSPLPGMLFPQIYIRVHPFSSFSSCTSPEKRSFLPSLKSQNLYPFSFSSIFRLSYHLLLAESVSPDYFIHIYNISFEYIHIYNIRGGITLGLFAVMVSGSITVLHSIQSGLSFSNC